MDYQDTMLPLANFLPKELSPAEKDAGVLGMTQYGSHATQFASRETASQLHTQTETSHSAEFPGFVKIWSYELSNI